MIFRKGGRRAANYGITLKGRPLKIVNNFKYLGITLQTGTSFKIHIQEKEATAIRAMYEIKNFQKVS